MICYTEGKSQHPGDIRSAEPRVRASAVNVLARHMACKGLLMSAVHRYTIETDI